jgi:hypothetical protein
VSDSPEEEIIEAALVEDEDPAGLTAAVDAPAVRRGSPFAQDPRGLRRRFAGDAAAAASFETGLRTVTAGGGVLSAGMLFPIGLAACWFFPGGAVAVAVLGGVMSVFGLSSLYPRWAVTGLGLHIAIFLLAEWRIWS